MDRNLIYDVGMNNGDDSAYYLSRGYRVVAIEAVPELVVQARERFQQEIEQGNLTILNRAIASQNGVLPFYICDTNSEWSSFDSNIAGRGGIPYRQIDVEATEFRTVLEEYGVPYYLKIDIEGNDHLCIEDLDPDNAPKYVSFEKPEQANIILQDLLSLGYEEFKCISQIHFLPFELHPDSEMSAVLSRAERWQGVSTRLGTRNVATRVLNRMGAGNWVQDRYRGLRTMGDWSFRLGSSGPFGEDTKGDWQSFEQIAETLDYFETKFQAGDPSAFWGAKDYSFWADIHARHQNAIRMNA